LTLRAGNSRYGRMARSNPTRPRGPTRDIADIK
jgi:hypothetical protein